MRSHDCFPQQTTIVSPENLTQDVSADPYPVKTYVPHREPKSPTENILHPDDSLFVLEEVQSRKHVIKNQSQGFVPVMDSLFETRGNAKCVGESCHIETNKGGIKVPVDAKLLLASSRRNWANTRHGSRSIHAVYIELQCPLHGHKVDIISRRMYLSSWNSWNTLHTCCQALRGWFSFNSMPMEQLLTKHFHW